MLKFYSLLQCMDPHYLKGWGTTQEELKAGISRVYPACGQDGEVWQSSANGSHSTQGNGSNSITWKPFLCLILNCTCSEDYLEDKILNILFRLQFDFVKQRFCKHLKPLHRLSSSPCRCMAKLNHLASTPSVQTLCWWPSRHQLHLPGETVVRLVLPVPLIPLILILWAPILCTVFQYFLMIQE